LPRFDLHCPFLSLPHAFNTRLDSIPAQIPYLAAPVAAIDKWRDRLGQNNVPRVGIVWSGRSTHANDANRSIALSSLMPLRSPDVQLVSLQNEVRAEDAKVLAANAQILHFGSELKDFSDTAALVSLVDLVVSVDTSVAHLAGALGKPVWILIPFAPDWRWLLEREDSPWYPTARLFRQPKIGDWDSVIDKVRQALTEHLGPDPQSIGSARV
jgi:Glycosyltransferase family 9 (heptosyltransferase)